jgi:iron complex outermembrane receptor protein
LKNILSLAIAFIAIPAFAQTSLDSILVQDNRLQIPYQNNCSDVQILDRKMIDALPVRSVNELLAYATATDVRQRGPWGTQADIGIDGSGFDEVLVLVNGIKLSDPQTGHNKLNLEIPLAAIERIEIMRGPASRIYGIDALAGAINIVTRTAAHNELTVEAFAGSSFESDTSSGATYMNWGTQATAALSTSNQSHLFSFGSVHGNGYRYNTDESNYRLFYGSTIRINKQHSIQALGAYANNDFGASLFYAAPNDKEAVERIETALGGLKWIYQASPRLRIMPVVSYKYNKDDYIYVRQKPEIYHNTHETNVVSTEVNASYHLKKGSIGAGLEWRDEEINSNSLGKRQRTNLGLYVGYEHHFSQKLFANAGFYLNHNSDYGTQVLPGVEAGYKLTQRWLVSANVGTGQRQPTYTDLYYKGPGNIGNDTLVAEHSLYFGATARYHGSRLQVAASYGYRRIYDFIDWVRYQENSPWQPQNYASSYMHIWSVRGSYDLEKQMGWSNGRLFKVNASYTYLEPSLSYSSELQTKYAIDALSHKALLGVNVSIINHLELSLDTRYQKRFNAADYWLANARLAYRALSFELYVDGNNLFNTEYYESGATPLPGRWISFGAKYKVTN